MPKNPQFLRNLANRVRRKKDDVEKPQKAPEKAPIPSAAQANQPVAPPLNGKVNKKDKNGDKKPIQQGDKKALTKDDLLIGLPQIRMIKDPEEQKKLFIKKLKLCSFTFDFVNENPKEAEAREMKRQMLVDLIDYLSNSKYWVSEESIKAILYMISSNLFRPLPPSEFADFDPDEDEPTHDPAWVHLQFVYEFLLRFIVSNNTDTKMLKKFIDRKFLLSVIDLFESDDPRERDYLKTILHRIYGKFMSFRSFLRRAMNNIFFNVIYVTGKHNGLQELLEILGSIINGFATPLKEEHQIFFRQVLIPLHKVHSLSLFHAQLAYCVVQFIEKEIALAPVVINGLLKYWPSTNCNKELLYLSEMEEVLEMTHPSEFQKLIVPLFSRVASCICSLHFQVAERALFLWNNDVIAAFMSDHRPDILPLLYPALHKNCEGHWNATVQQLTQHILQQFKDMDEQLFNTVKKHHEKTLKNQQKNQKRQFNWDMLKQQLDLKNNNNK